jgi:hypothetical protein
MDGFEVLEPRLLLSGSPLVFDGFDSGSYAAGSQLDGSDPTVSGFDGTWAGSGSSSIESGSLSYAGLGAAGDNRVQLNNSITVSREFALGVGDPLENFIDINGNIGTSLDGTALYLSVLMQIDGAAPPASTFSLYNDGASSTDRTFRIVYSGSKSAFQAIAGPSGTAVNLDALNNGTNLFVIKIDFAVGNDTISLWQNPTAGLSEPAPDAQVTNYDIAFDRLAFSRFLGTGTSQFDELRLGNIWSAVTDEAALPLIPRAPISADGFNSAEYTSGNTINGIASFVPGFDNAWLGAGSSTIQTGSLTYTGLGAAGSNHLLLNSTDVVSRLLLDGNNGPLANYIDANGDFGTSLDGSALYLSLLMQVDGASPPASTFSLYNDGISSSDREFRILYSTSNTNFQVIAGESGTSAELDTLNSNTNLFVIKIEFAPGNDTISIWQNPTAGDTEPAPNAQITDYDIAFDRLAFTRFSGTGTARFDEVRLGNVWSAVTDEAALNLIPGPQTIVAMQGAPPSPLGNGTYPVGFFPFIDEFGQYRYTDWDDKIDSLDEMIQSATDEAADLAANPGPADLNEYGGWLAGPQLNATGYFRTQKVDGKWWLVDPDGRLFFSNGITGVSDPDREGSAGSAVKTGVSDRVNYFADLPEPGDPAAQFLTAEASTVTSGYYQGDRPLSMNFYAANALTKYGTDWEADSQGIAHDRLQSWGMNTIGAWSDEDVYLQGRTAYTIVLFPTNPSLINGSSTFPDYFDPAYLVNVKARINQEAGKTLNDPWNLGYFIHNELSWTRSSSEDIDVGLKTLAATSTQHAKIAFRDQLETKYGTIQALNAQWQTNYASWTDLLVQRNVIPNLTGADADLVAFDVLYANQYFSTTQQAMREAAPNHLYLGARFTGGVRVSAAQAAVAYADVVSINRYGPDVSVLPAGLEGDVPLISGEFHYSANDTGLWSDGLKPVADQATRAGNYSTYLQSALDSDRYVGMHWLQYWDFPTAGKLNSNNNNSNLGFVSITDTPYTGMVDAARSVGADLYETRVGDFAFVVDRTLHVVGTEAEDQIGLAVVAGDLDVTRNGVTHTYTLADFDDVIVSGGYGDDTVGVTGLVGKSLTILGADAGDTIDISGGDFTLIAGTPTDGPGVLIDASAIVELSTGIYLDSLVNNGWIGLTSPLGSPGVLTLGGLTMGPTATLDLANNGLVVDYASASPLVSIRVSIIGSYNAGGWDVNGITTGYGDANQSAVGYGESAGLLGPGGGLFMGQQVDDSAVLIRHTLYGDANLSGGVDGSDFNIWNTSRNGVGDWSDADFNYDGVVDQADLSLWQGNRFTSADSVQPPPVAVAVERTAESDPVPSVQAPVLESMVATEPLSVAVVTTPVTTTNTTATAPLPPVDTALPQKKRAGKREKFTTETDNPGKDKMFERLRSWLSGVQQSRVGLFDPEMPAWFQLPALDIHLPGRSQASVSRVAFNIGDRDGSGGRIESRLMLDGSTGSASRIESYLQERSNRKVIR